MKDEYDFTNAERGKFYRQDGQIQMPVYLDEDVSAYLSKRAAETGVGLNQLVNDLLKRDIDLIESVKP